MVARPGAGGWRWTLALALLVGRLARAAEPMPAEVRVLSTPGLLPSTTITVRATPDTVIEDRTVGARPAGPEQGPASIGETFRDEVRLVLRGMETARPAVVEVTDALVSMVRVQPEESGTVVVVFVRQPVAYVVTRPAASGEIAITVRSRPAPPSGRARKGAPPPPDDDQVAVDAAEVNYDQERDVVVARGGVTITRGAVTLQADEVRYDRRSGIADATGNVVLTDPGSTIEGSAAQIDLNDEAGWMESVAAQFPASGYSLQSSRVEKGLGPRYRVADGIFTTCRCGGLERPSWSIAGRRTDVELNGIGVVRDATFRVKDVPVFWAPILPFPALTDRASGFLMPNFGYSNRRGFQYEQPFFWNISKSQDATIALDVETNARVGVLGEYRYALSKTSKGAFAGGYWNESFRGPNADLVLSSQAPTSEPPINRWLVLGRATHALAPDRNLYTDIFAVSDQTLVRDITNLSSTLDSGLRFRSARLTKSRAGAIETWERGLWQAEGTYYQDLIDPQDLTPQRAPFLRAEQALPVIGNRLVARLAGQTTNFQRNDGFDGFRGDLSPELFLPFSAWRALHGSVTGRLHGTLYRLGDDRPVALVSPDDPAIAPTYRAIGNPSLLTPLDSTHLRGVAVVRGQLGTELARVYAFPRWGLERIRHSIEPELRYLYVPDVDQEYQNATLDPRVAPVRPAGCEQPRNRSLPECRRYRSSRSVFDTINGRYVNGMLDSRGYLFDELDAINRRNFISYGVTSRVVGRLGGGLTVVTAAGTDDDDEDDDGPPEGIPAGPTRELLRFGVRHGIDPSREINRDSHLANLDLGLRMNPLTYMSLSYFASMNVAGGRLAAQNAAFSLLEPNWVPQPGNPFQSPSAITVAYRFVEENVNAGVPDIGNDFANVGVRNVLGSVYLRLGNYAGFAFGAIYDFNPGFVFENDVAREVGPHFILREYLLRFISPCNCWAAEFGVTDNFQTDERLFRLQVTLLGLGSFGQGRRGINYTGISTLPRIGGPRPTAIGPAGGLF